MRQPGKRLTTQIKEQKYLEMEAEGEGEDDERAAIMQAVLGHRGLG